MQTFIIIIQFYNLPIHCIVYTLTSSLKTETFASATNKNEQFTLFFPRFQKPKHNIFCS